MFENKSMLRLVFANFTFHFFELLDQNFIHSRCSRQQCQSTNGLEIFVDDGTLHFVMFLHSATCFTSVRCCLNFKGLLCVYFLQCNRTE